MKIAIPTFATGVSPGFVSARPILVVTVDESEVRREAWTANAEGAEAEIQGCQAARNVARHSKPGGCGR